ncbi:S-layer homology domain-containing protein [Paenibacillus sp. TAB 01]|uniref:RCC1 domain-containing protein n=1 Tax=Paenibacillus sp. TAB 01 TaxID=3368988 RepID=UPI003750524E
MPRFNMIVQPPKGGSFSNEPSSNRIAAGDSFTVVRKLNRLWTWGENTYGELGTGTVGGKNTPAETAPGAGEVTAVEAGSHDAFVLKPDGTVWSWGLNLNGQLADGTSDNRNAPAAAPLLKDVAAIAAGNAFTLALKKDGTVWGIGDNTFGQLADNTASPRTTPVQISGLFRIKAIAAGYNHALALAEDGTLWAWGDNSNGQLGDGSTMLRRAVVPIEGLKDVQAIAAGRNHSLALKSDGTVWTWGYNGFGQLGDGTTTNKSQPVPVAGLTGVASIAAGSYHSLAVKTNGTVWAWGQGTFGQLGDGGTENRSQAVQAKGILGAAEAAGGSYHSAAISADGTVWTWGSNMSGQLGDGTYKNRTFPEAVTGFVSAFRDTAGHWAEAAIASAVEKGYADGYPDGTFKPDGTLTRAEFAKLTASALKLPDTAAQAASGSAWYQPYADALTKAGYYGPKETQGAWDEPITRAELARIAAKVTTQELQGANTAMTDDFAMLTAVKKGILQGLRNGELAPAESSTRAQAVTIIERMLSVRAGVALPVDTLALTHAQQP